jgi:hypothetical protein
MHLLIKVINEGFLDPKHRVVLILYVVRPGNNCYVLHITVKP